MKTELSTWLRFALREASGYGNFLLYDAVENSEVSPEIRQYLVTLVRKSRINPTVLEAASRAGQGSYVATVATGLPKVSTAQGGDFGEILTSAALIEFLDYTVPVPKLLFGINPDQGMPSTDAIAIKRDGDKLSEICFVESKTRTSRDNDAAGEGYDQLANDYSQKLSQMILFVLNRLAERNDDLLDSFLDYAFDRRDTLDIESFHIGLTWEEEVWSDAVLSNLEAKVIKAGYPKLSVHLLCHKGLRQLTQEIFEESRSAKEA